MDPAHGRDRPVRVLGGAEHGGGQEPGRPLQAAEGVAAERGVVGDTGHRQRVQGLQHEGPQAPDQGGQLAVDPPGHAVRSEQAVVALVGHPLGQVGRVRARRT